MSWQSPCSDSTSEDYNDLLDKFITFERNNYASPKSLESGKPQEYDVSHELNPGVDNPTVLTVLANIDTVLQYLETERKKGNSRPIVVVKLKDPAERKSITFPNMALHSPATTATSSIAGDSRPSTRAASPKPIYIHASLAEARMPPPEEIHCHAAEDILCIPPNRSSSLCMMSSLQSQNAVWDGILSAEREPLAQEAESPSELITPREAESGTWVKSNEHPLPPMVQHDSTTPPTSVPTDTAEIGVHELPSTTPLMSTVQHHGSLTSQKTSSIESHNDESATASYCTRKRRNNSRKRPPPKGECNAVTKRRRLETTELATLFDSTTQYMKVKEWTVGQEPQLVSKMVRNAIAIRTEADHIHLEEINTNAMITNNDCQDLEDRQEEIVQKFYTTVRRIEWVEATAFHSMVEYRVLFVQLYEHYLLLQSIVDMKKGERRVTLAKERLYTMLYPNKPKFGGDGRTSDEWERFNRWIRRGKQWHTIASELGISVLQRMPPSIRHTWVEQKLQTKEQLNVWIRIVRLLT